VLLGHAIKGRGFAEVQEALDILSRHPATARHISLQLATYFVSDNPPPALVDRMARAFQHTDGDIPRCCAPCSARRSSPPPSDKVQGPGPLCDLGGSPGLRGPGDPQHRPIQGWLNRMAEGLYNHETRTAIR